MAYKLSKDEIVEMVRQFSEQIVETASKIGEKSAYGFLFGNADMTITAETVANEIDTFGATLRAYIAKPYKEGKYENITLV